MSNEFPKLSEVFTLDKAVSYQETIEKVWLPQDNAMVSVPSVSPIETIELVGNTITPRTALVQITYNTYLTDKILHFIDYSNLRDGAILHIRIQDDTFPITIKNGVVGNGGILTADGSDITLDDYRKVVQFQREGSIWRQVGGIQMQADLQQTDETRPDFVKGKELLVTKVNNVTPIDGNVDTYPSQVGNDGKFLTTDGTTASWAEIGGGLEIGDIGFAPLGIDETQNKRRYLNGQVISQTQFATFTDKVKAAIALYPSLSATETNWQAEVTNSKLGQCGKFVIDDAAGTIRLPKVVNINGLTDLSLMGSIKAESLPNITGNTEETAGTYLQADGNSSQNAGNGALFYKEVGTATSHSGSGGKFVTVGFDASRSSSTYQDNAHVQQEAVQYPYFIQVATGSEESVDVSTEIQLNNPFSLLDYKWSEYELNNASWLISNGSFHSGATYVAVYELLLKIKNGTETKEGVSVKLSTEVYEDTDFVLNTTDTTFRLPIKVKLASGNAVVGNGMTLGLTDGQTNQGLDRVGAGTFVPGIAAYGTNVGSVVSTGGGKISTYGITTDPLKSGIETSSQGLYLYFYVGETIQDANVINAAGVLTKVANSIDRNVASDRETVVGWGIADYNAAVSLNSLTFTAPYDCEVFGFMKVADASNNAYCKYTPFGGTEITILNNFGYNGSYYVDAMPLIKVMRKGDKLTFSGISSFSGYYAPLKGVN